MQSIERMKAVSMKTKGTTAHRRLMISEARMLRDASAQQKQQQRVQEIFKVEEMNV